MPLHQLLKGYSFHVKGTGDLSKRTSGQPYVVKYPLWAKPMYMQHLPRRHFSFQRHLLHTFPREPRWIYFCLYFIFPSGKTTVTVPDTEQEVRENPLLVTGTGVPIVLTTILD